MHAIRDAPGWLVFLAAIGVVAIGAALLTMFFKVGDGPTEAYAEGPIGFDAHEFMRPMAALLGVPLRQGGRIELLNNGDAWLASLLADIAAAKNSITFSVYIWEPGAMSDVMFEALFDRVKAGVQVRVLLDGLGCIRCPHDGIDRLRAAGARVERFRPLRIGKMLRFNQRNHRRAIVIDGLVGYTGGMAVGDKWLGDARNPDEWRDTMVRITGCPVESVQSAFTEIWAYITGEVLSGTAFFPPLEGEDSQLWSMGVVSSPAPEKHPMGLFFFLVFSAARKKLWITNPYFIPDDEIRTAIAQRARAGVDIRLLLPDEHIDAKVIRRASQRYYQELMDAGVRIYEYQTTMIHTKLVVADGVFSVVGSANLDIRSNELNEENVIGILDEGFGATLEQTFLEDLKSAKQIDPEQWKRRSLYARVAERVFAFFQEQF